MRQTLLIATIAFSTTLAAAETTPVAQLMEQAAVAHGGAAAITGLRSIIVEWQITDIWAEQSRRPDPPWDRSQGIRRYAFDLQGARYSEYVKQQFAGGYDFHYQAVIDGPRSQLTSFIDGYRRTLPADELPQRSADLRHSSPLLLLRALLARPDAIRPLPAETVAGKSYSVLAFATAEGEELRLYFEATSHRLTQLIQVLPDGGERRLVYEDFAERSGLIGPRRIRMFYRGELVWDIDVRRVRYNRPIDALLDSPTAFPLIDVEAPAGVRDFAIRDIAEGMYFIGAGVEYQLFVEYDDFVVALGSVGGIERRLQALAERVGPKPVRYAVVTHHHSDHLEGVPALVDSGVILLTAPDHEAIVRRTAGADREVRIETVADRRSLGDGPRRLDIIQIGPNVHAEQMLVGWLPGVKLLWSADMFVQPPERPIRAAIGPIFDLAQAISRLELDVQLLLDPHSPRLNSIADLRESVAKGSPRHAGEPAQ